MKKMIIAAAVASILAPATVLADTTLYGALRMSAIGGDDGAADLGGVVNNASRIGFKGTYGEEGGIQGFFNMQQGIRTDSSGAVGGTSTGFTNRFAFAGIKGSFGKMVMGRISTPYKMAGLKTDPFYDTSAGTGAGGANYGLSSLTNGWLNNSLGYVSPKLGGAVTVNAAVFLDEDDNASNSTLSKNPADNAYNVGATYSQNGITASVQYLAGFQGDDSNDEAVRVTAGYKTGAFSVGASFEDIDTRGANNSRENAYVAGTYKVAPKTTLAASFGSVDSDIVGGTGLNAEGDGFTVGVFHKIASQTTVSALYSEVDYDLAASPDRDVFALGLIQKF